MADPLWLLIFFTVVNAVHTIKFLHVFKLVKALGLFHFMPSFILYLNKKCSVSPIESEEEVQKEVGLVNQEKLFANENT